jgi:predicted 3-demethylubiquinone-9 3-methyltransferase (glyoxalase superfamily)
MTSPFLWLDNNVPEAVAFYTSVFPMLASDGSSISIGFLRRVG